MSIQRNPTYRRFILAVKHINVKTCAIQIIYIWVIFPLSTEMYIRVHHLGREFTSRSLPYTKWRRDHLKYPVMRKEASNSPLCRSGCDRPDTLHRHRNLQSRPGCRTAGPGLGCTRHSTHKSPALRHLGSSPPPDNSTWWTNTDLSVQYPLPVFSITIHHDGPACKIHILLAGHSHLRAV